MRIITVMNYNTEPYIAMCKGWFYFVRKFHPNAEIIVYHNESISKELLRKDVIYKKLDVKNVPVILKLEPKKVNKLAVHKEWSKYEDFIFLDADAYPLTSLEDLYNSCIKPVTFCGHEPGNGEGPSHLNSGVFVQKTNLFTYDNLIDMRDKYGDQLRYLEMGSDQLLIQTYLKDIGYDPFDWDIMGHEYNSAAAADITIEGDTVTAISKITKKNIKVLHGYSQYKFWNNSDTSKFWKYVNRIDKDNNYKE